jgi:hypothetical protein
MADLSAQYVVDIVSAATASTLVSPFVGIIDKSIISHASGRKPLRQGLRDDFIGFLKNPSVFYRQRFSMFLIADCSGVHLDGLLWNLHCRKRNRNNLRTFKQGLARSQIHWNIHLKHYPQCLERSQLYENVWN